MFWIYFPLIVLSIAVDPDVRRNTTEYVAIHGYAIEEFPVITQDGYILTLHHMPARGSNRSGVIFLMPGFTCSAFVYVLNEPAQTLPYLLVDAGWDVWIGNARGTLDSRRHERLLPSENAFWDWTFDEIAAYDMPAMINFALAHSGAPSLVLVGHSEGCADSIAALTAPPQGRLLDPAKVAALVLLSPAVYMGRTESILTSLGRIKAAEVIKALGVRDFDVPAALHHFWPGICRALPWLCDNLVCVLAGCESTKQLNASKTPILVAHFPSGTSVFDAIHLSQMIRTRKFQRMDFGKTENMRRYGQPAPPEYDPATLQTPTLLYYGSHDLFVNAKDIEELLLPKLQSAGILRHVRRLEHYGHGDPIWSLDAHKDFYPELLSFLEAYRL